MRSPSDDQTNGGTGGKADAPPTPRWRGVSLAVALVAATMLSHAAPASVVVPDSLRATEATSRSSLPSPLSDDARGAREASSPARGEIVIGLDPVDGETAVSDAALLDDAALSALRPQAFDPFAIEGDDGSPLAVSIVDASGIRRAAAPVRYSAPTVGIRRPSGRAGLRGLLAQYVNIIPTQARAAASRAEPAERAPNDDAGEGASPGGGGDLVAERVSETVSDWLGHVFRPTAGIEGLVSFSVVGFGNFAIVASEDSRRIGVMDLNSGRVMTVSTSHAGVRPGGTVMIERKASGNQRPRRTRATRFSDVIGAIVAFLYEFVTSPLKMSFTILALIAWGVWRASASRV